ncbi:response regulator [Candidatus Microgenomates bacterium]|nr:response regulator [Candidatus Microgenomates bacterium]
MVGKKLLLIEDEDTLRFLYNRQLTHAQYAVDQAANGEEGVKFMNQNAYDLILLDLMLPDTNGIDILRKLNTEGQIKKSPIILLTNLADDAIIQEAYRLGIIGYIIKAQFTPDQIIQQVDDFVTKAKTPSEDKEQKM